ncbi:MAG: BCD family MFS transporter [Chloroflexi bacterium]|nr:BCD family MFS transporter [Chloroflexota bacterium]
MDITYLAPVKSGIIPLKHFRRKDIMIIKRLQLSLIHVAIAMTLVPINSTLNRVMIKELNLSATFVAILVSLPYILSPIQVAIGSYADRHPLWGRRRTPYILLGLCLCVCGAALAPAAAFLMAQSGWAGVLLGLLAFGAWGMGFNFATVSYLSLASELSGEQGRSRTISIMWFMMISSVIITAIAVSRIVNPYSPEALIQAFQWVCAVALVLGIIGLIRLEAPFVPTSEIMAPRYSWAVLAQAILGNRQATLFFGYLIILLAAILGQDVLLEPFAGEAFGMAVSATTRITSVWGVCVLATLLIAGVLESRFGKRRIAKWGAVGALAGFLIITLSGALGKSEVFYAGVILLGLGTGLSTVANLSLMLDMTTISGVGLFIGAWGMADALARLVGSMLAGVIRDVVTQISQQAVAGYLVVFAVEAAFLFVSLFLLRRIDVQAFRSQAEQPTLAERAALLGEAQGG